MSFWTAFKLLAALSVLAVMSFTGLLAYHVMVTPLGGLFRAIIPHPAEVIGRQPEPEFAKMLDSAELPDIDPGEKAFQKAHELLALGKLGEAREKLTAIVNVFPTSSTAPVARRIVGEMNLDEIFSASNLEGKKSHTVKRGNSFLGIASEYKTTLDSIMNLNGMMELRNLQPGEEIVVMPLEFRLLIEPKRKALSLWQGGRFIRDYPILSLGTVGLLRPGRTSISSKIAELDGHQVVLPSKDYRAATKILQIAKPLLQIRGVAKVGNESAHGITMLGLDMEEISLLTRVGNEVEIR